MAGASAVMTLRVLSDVKDAQKGLDEATSRVGKFSGAVDKGAKVAAAGFLAVGAGALMLAKGAAEDQKAATALAQTLKNTARATDAQVAATEDWISAQGKALGVADDELRPALTKLASATHDVDKAQRLTSLAMNISAGSGKSLESVSAALAKAQLGNVAGLSKLGIKTKETTMVNGKLKTTVISADEAMRRLSKTYKGQAAAAAGTLEGKTKILQVQLAEAGETIGYALLPVLTELANWIIANVLPAIDQMFTLISENQGTAIAIGIAIAGIGTAVIGASLALKAYAAVMNVVKVATAVWTAAQWALNASFLGFPLVWIVVAIAAVIAAVVLVVKHWSTVKAVLATVWSAIQSGTRGVLNWLRANWPMLLAILTGPIGIAVLMIVKNWDKIGGGAKAAYDGIKRWLGKAWDYISSLPGKIKDAFSNVWSGLAQGLKAAINAVLHLPLKIPRIDTKVPGIGKVGGQTLIPALAKGGIVNRPTLALIGEAGPEAVVPLNKRNTPALGASGTVELSEASIEKLAALLADIATRIAQGMSIGQARRILAGSVI